MNYQTYGEVFTTDLVERMLSGVPDVREICFLADVYRRRTNREKEFENWFLESGLFSCGNCTRKFESMRADEADEILCGDCRE